MIRTNIEGVIGEISDLPGCPQIAVSHYVFMRDGQKGQGKGQVAHKERIKLSQELGYDYILCTVISTNELEKHILKKNGWKKLDSFKSSKSKNEVEIWGRLSFSKTEYDPDSPENKTYDAWERSFDPCRS